MSAPTNPNAAQAPPTAASAISPPDVLEQCASKDLSKQDLSGSQWAGRNLVDFNFERADLSGADLSNADLSGANLSGANLVDANLEGANLRGAHLNGCHAKRANFTRASLSHADIARADFESGLFIETDFTKAHARKARFHLASMARCKMIGADFSRATMTEITLYGAYLSHANFDRTDLRGAHMAGIRDFEHASWRNVDIRGVDLHGTYLARRHISDENFLHEFRSRGQSAQATYFIWWLTSNCGRSILRWSLFTALLTVIFAKMYTLVQIDYGPHETWFSPFYFSVVTMTSLGFGDVVPQTTAGQAIAMVEVILGYVMLGGSLSIFSTKMARRAD